MVILDEFQQFENLHTHIHAHPLTNLSGFCFFFPLAKHGGRKRWKINKEERVGTGWLGCGNKRRQSLRGLTQLKLTSCSRKPTAGLAMQDRCPCAGGPGCRALHLARSHTLHRGKSAPESHRLLHAAARK